MSASARPESERSEGRSTANFGKNNAKTSGRAPFVSLIDSKHQTGSHNLSQFSDPSQPLMLSNLRGAGDDLTMTVRLEDDTLQTDLTARDEDRSNFNDQSIMQALPLRLAIQSSSVFNDTRGSAVNGPS